MRFYPTDQIRFVGKKQNGYNTSGSYVVHEVEFVDKVSSLIALLEDLTGCSYTYLDTDSGSLPEYVNASSLLARKGYMYVLEPDIALLGITSVSDLDESISYTVVIYKEDSSGSHLEVHSEVSFDTVKYLCETEDAEIAYLYRFSDIKTIAEYATDCFMEKNKKLGKGLEGYSNE